MNLRGRAYFAAHRLAGSKLPQYYFTYCAEDRGRDFSEIAQSGLRNIIEYATTRSPYYRALAHERGIPSSDDPAAMLARFPVLTKDIIREQRNRLTAEDIAGRRPYTFTSGGSTGQPVEVVLDQEFHARQDALQLLGFRWAGADIGDSQVWLWGSEREVLQGNVELKYRVANLIKDHTLVNAYHMTPERMRQCLLLLNRKRPRLIMGYVQVLYELAKFARREAVPVMPQHALVTTAGTLFPEMRTTLEDVFGCPVFNSYGSREAGGIAFECPAHSCLHVLPWESYVEVVDERGAPVPPGTEGRILVTSLINKSMPMLRYDIGDRGALAPEGTCACGRSGQRLLRVSGRNTDVFIARDGTRVDGTYFHFLEYPWIWRFQAVQERMDFVRFRIVRTGATFPESDVEEIRAKIRAVLGADCEVSIEFVDDIPQLASGKYRYTISLVDPVHESSRA